MGGQKEKVGLAEVSNGAPISEGWRPGNPLEKEVLGRVAES